MFHLHSKARTALSVAWRAVLLGATLSTAVLAGPVPSGEVTFAENRVEPAYDGRDGSFAFLLTPENARENANAHAVAELYIIMYPTQSAAAVGTMICQHQPMDNCPDHGPTLAGLAMAMIPGVYGNGVWGHDHLISAPPAPGHDDDGFHVAWMPVAVLFKTAEAAANHVTTLSQLDAARAAGQVMEIPLPPATFHGGVVPAGIYERGTPIPPAPPLP
jgi:hypothetical protein